MKTRSSKIRALSLGINSSKIKRVCNIRSSASSNLHVYFQRNLQQTKSIDGQTQLSIRHFATPTQKKKRGKHVTIVKNGQKNLYFSCENRVARGRFGAYAPGRCMPLIAATHHPICRCKVGKSPTTHLYVFSLLLFPTRLVTRIHQRDGAPPFPPKSV